jgi:UDP-N-acetylglucosamine acyltransferase
MATIHPTAIVHPGAQLGENVVIGPYSIIGEHVELGDNTEVQSHVVVDGHTRIGRNCRLFPFACIGMQTQDLKYAGGTTYAEIGDGTTLREFATVHTGTRDGEVTRIGQKCLIMAYVHVAHGCRVGNEVIMSNAVQLAGEVEVDDMAIISGMTGVHQFTRIGRMAMIGAATKIAQDVPPYMVRGPNVVGMQRRNVPTESRSAIKQAYKLLYREGLNHSQAIERIRAEVLDCPEVRELTSFVEKSTRGIV